MPDYVFSARGVRDGAFLNEPGPTRYLQVPDGADPTPAQAIATADWISAVIKAACNGVDAVLHQPTGDILVFVHGYNTSPIEMIQRHRRLQESLQAVGFDGVVVSFDWPSANVALNYLEDRIDAKLSAFSLVSDGIALLLATQTAECRIRINMLGYSMGAYVIREAFDDADDRPLLAAHNWTVNQVCFVAADVSSLSMTFGNARSNSLYRHSLRVTNYYSPYDAVLRLSNVKRAGVAERAGRVGLPLPLATQAVDVNCGPYYRRFLLNIEEMDEVSSHAWYFENPLFAQDLYYTLQGNVDPRWLPTRIRLPEAGLALWPPDEPPNVY